MEDKEPIALWSGLSVEPVSVTGNMWNSWVAIGRIIYIVDGVSSQLDLFLTEVAS